MGRRRILKFHFATRQEVDVHYRQWRTKFNIAALAENTSSHYTLPLQSCSVCTSVHVETVECECAQHGWKWSLGLKGAWDGGAGENDGCEEGELDTVRSTGVDAVASEQVLLESANSRHLCCSTIDLPEGRQ